MAATTYKEYLAAKESGVDSVELDRIRSRLRLVPRISDKKTNTGRVVGKTFVVVDSADNDEVVVDFSAKTYTDEYALNRAANRIIRETITGKRMF